MSIELIRVDENQSPLQMAVNSPQWAVKYIQSKYGHLSLDQIRYNYGLPKVSAISIGFGGPAGYDKYSSIMGSSVSCAWVDEIEKPGSVKRTWRNIIEGLKFWWSEIW